MNADTGRRVALLCAASLTVMSAATIAPSLPQMAAVFRDAADAQYLTKLILTTPALFIAVCAPLSGAIIDRFGRIRYLRACLCLYAAAGSSGFLLSDLHRILAGRALLGVAVAGTMTCVSALAGDYFSGAVRVRYISTQSAFMSIGGVLFVGLGGVLADVHWRAPFLLYLSALLVLAMVIAWLDEPQMIAPQGLHSADSAESVIPARSIAAIYALQFFSMTVYYMMAAQLPFLLGQMGATRSSTAGFTIAIASLTSGLTTFLYTRVLRLSSYVGVYAIGFAVIALGYGLIGISGAVEGVVVGAALGGCGIGLLFPNGNVWLLSLAPARYRGRLAGGLAASVFLGQFFSPVLVEPVAERIGLPATYRGTAAVLSAIALGIAARQRAKRRAGEVGPP